MSQIQDETIIHTCVICGKNEPCRDEITQDCDFRTEFQAHGMCLSTQSTIHNPQIELNSWSDLDDLATLEKLLPEINKMLETANLRNQNDVNMFVEAIKCKSTIQRKLREHRDKIQEDDYGLTLTPEQEANLITSFEIDE